MTSVAQPSTDDAREPASLDGLFERAAREHGDTTLHFGQAGTLTLARLLELGHICAHTLAGRGLAPGAVVAVVLPAGRDVLPALFGIARTGLVPTVLPTPGTVHRSEFAERLRRVVADANVRAVITLPEWVPRVTAALAALQPYELILPGEWCGRAPSGPAPRRTAELALLQYSSGSTAEPKGVCLTHENLLTGIAAIIAGGALAPGDVGLQWMPLYHDMGLLGLLAAVSRGVSQHVTDPLSPFRSPGTWLRYLSDARVTYFGSPCTTLAYLADNVAADDLRGLDLTALRHICVGAEPLAIDAIERFTARFAPVGLRPDVIHPAYGMAEATLGVSSRAIGAPLRIDWVDREVLGRRGQAERVPARAPGGRAIYSLGTPLPGIELQVVDRDGAALGDDREGEVEIRGPAVMSNYLHRPRSDSHRGAWLRTGDLGYLSRGELFVTGRLKQVVIVNGVNYHAEDCEAALRGLDGVFHGRCVALDLDDGRAMTLVVETRVRKPSARAALAAAIRARVRESVGLADVRVALARPRTIPHTTSGKPQRVPLRERIRRRELGAPELEFIEHNP